MMDTSNLLNSDFINQSPGLAIVLLATATICAVTLSFSFKTLLPKSNRLRNLLPVLIALVGLTWFIPYFADTQITGFVGFYNFLIVAAMAYFLILIYVLSLLCSMLLEWAFLAPELNPGKDRQKPIRLSNLLAAMLSLIGCVIFALAVLRNLSYTLQDVLMGPQFKTGIIERVIFRAGTTSFTGFVVVEGAEYQIPDHAWFSSLSNGQSIGLTYSYSTHYGFSPNQAMFTPLAAITLILLVCPPLVIWGMTLHKVIFPHKSR